MPPFGAFRDAESYYATLLHELTHNADSRTMLRRLLTLLVSKTFQHSISGIIRGIQQYSTKVDARSATATGDRLNRFRFSAVDG